MTASEKSIGDLRLIEACRQPGCPVCRRVTEESRARLRALLHELVTDPETRRDLRASWGLCNWHTWMLLDLDARALGASILHEDLLREAIDRLADAAAPPRRTGLRAWLGRAPGATPAIVAARDRRPPCSLCVGAAETERQCLLGFVRWIDDADLAAAYAVADPVCLPHIARAIELTPEPRAVQGLVERTREKWLALRVALRSFIDKSDYRNRAPYTEDEAAAYTRAFEVIAGARGMFGTDGLGRADTGRRRGQG